MDGITNAHVKFLVEKFNSSKLSQKQRRKEEEGEKRRKRKDDRERKRNPKTTRGSALRPKPQLPPAKAGPIHMAKLVEHQNQEEKTGTL